MAMHLLHGSFHVTILRAENVADETRYSSAAPNFLKKIVRGVENQVVKITNRLYATIDMERTRVGRTRILEDGGANPMWNECFHIYCAFHVAHVVVSVKRDNIVSASLFGRAKVPAQDILTGNLIEGWYDIFQDNGEKLKGGARIFLRMQFFDARKDPWWGQGIKDINYPGVPFTFFKQWKGCKVTLYQDAHVHNDFLPRISLDRGRTYAPGRCWEDIFSAISGAQHFIYIAGWSVYTVIKLVRDDKSSTMSGNAGVTLGELLKKKAEEGVRVNLLVWDDRTSVGVVKKDGLMATHDQETCDYFNGSKVNCVLCPRNPDDSLSKVQEFQVGAMFTHHQKTVIVDAASAGAAATRARRRVVGFLGGIDLCDGRYDTQEHFLFRTLGTVHKDDFHQPNFDPPSVCTIKSGGPREPWHDIHCRLEGQPAWDVLYNFEQRWRKQGNGNDKLVAIKTIRQIDPPSPVTFENDPETWHAQVFRSIDGGAADGFPSNPIEAAKAGLVSGKDSTIDRSIQDAYINAIRRAKNFIYIENQYFLGSCASWDEEQDAGCFHLIPVEIALKIASKIEANEPFVAYIVVPMWPEGPPTSGAVQAILDWMRRTMQMMYKIIAGALKAKGKYNVSPKDYLMFFCLGNRETRVAGEYLPPESPPDGSDYKKAQDYRRFMIYVHAKMMIVDDEYIILGSANINQRSMDGARDSEIAMGAYQPFYLAGKGSIPKGQIHGLRMALWYEHTRRLDDAYTRPWSSECVKKMTLIGDSLWNAYVGERTVDLEGHLLTYPVAISNDGIVSQLPGWKYFPDTQAPILGTKSETLPPILTT